MIKKREYKLTTFFEMSYLNELLFFLIFYQLKTYMTYMFNNLFDIYLNELLVLLDFLPTKNLYDLYV